MYGLIQKLLNDEYDVHETVLIESPFRERTRKGRYCRTVILGITPGNLVIASGKNSKNKYKHLSKGGLKIKFIDLSSLYPLRFIDLTIFKRTYKQSIKVAYNNVTRYFELGKMDKRKVFWKLWCLHVNEIRKGRKLWPYTSFADALNQTSDNNRLRWTDKYLFLGPLRHAEDQVRPTPVPGLGRSDEIKLFYLKPQYFGCRDQSEHWVQCEEVEESRCDYDVDTYTGVPTSNVTYTPLTTTLKGIEQSTG